MHAELVDFLSSPLCVEKSWLNAFVHGVEHGQMPAEHTATPRQASKNGRIAIVGINGPLVPRATPIMTMFGFVGYDWIQKVMTDLASDKDIGSIVMDVNSPGGTAAGAEETADVVRSVAKVKPVFAVANSLMASGAYYISAPATEIVASPSASVGSIGVIMTHEDWSQALDRAGVKVTHIYAGKYKAEGNFEEPLSDEAKTHYQSRANGIYDQFVSTVARGRNVRPETVKNGFGQGRVLLAKEAKDERLVDSVATLGEVVQKLTGRGRSTASVAARLRLAEAE